MRALLILLIVSGCSAQSLMIDTTIELAKTSQTHIKSTRDIELVAQSAATSIMHFETLQASHPEDARLSLLLSQAYLAYLTLDVAEAYEEAELSGNIEHAEHLAERLLILSQRGIQAAEQHMKCETIDTLDLNAFRQCIENEVDGDEGHQRISNILSFWSLQALAGDAKAIGRVSFILQAIQLMQSNARPHPQGRLLFASIKSALPGIGDDEKLRIWNEARQVDGSLKFLTDVAYVRSYLAPNGKETEANALLETILDHTEVDDNGDLTSTLARQKARRYLRYLDEMIEEVDESVDE